MSKKHLNSILFLIILVVFIFVIKFAVTCTKADKENKQNEIQETEQTIKTGSLKECIENIEELKVLDIKDNTKQDGFILVTIKDTTNHKQLLISNCYKILNAVRQNKNYNNIKRIDIMFMGDFVDKYGKKIEEKSMSASFDKSELDKINWDNFNWRKNLLNIANNVWFHSALKNSKK